MTQFPFMRRRLKPAPPATTPPASGSQQQSPASNSLMALFGGSPAQQPPAPQASAPSPVRQLKIRTAQDSPAISLARPPKTTAPAAPAASSTASAAPATGLSLNLAAAKTTEPVKHPDQILSSRLFEAPYAQLDTELNEQQQMVRLPRVLSGIGTLEVEGTTALAWESDQLVTGAALADGTQLGRSVPTSGNRPLAALEDGRALITLRHVRQLRRAVFISQDNSALKLHLYGGTRIAVRPIPGYRSVLVLTQIGGLVELRIDPAHAGSTPASIWESFGFLMSL